MSKLTENESKVSKIIENVLAEEIAAKPEIKNLCAEVKLKPYSAGEKMPKILIVSVSKDVLKFLRMHYKKYLEAMNRDFNGSLILTIRSSSVPDKKGLFVNREREEFLKDLCFPAAIVGRTQEVEDRKDITQVVYLDSKQSYWNEASLKALTCLSNEMLKDNYQFPFFSN